MIEDRYILCNWSADNVDENGTIRAILGYYPGIDAPIEFETWDDVDDDDMIAIVGSIVPDEDGFMWSVEDSNGPVDSGWEPSLLRAVREHVKCAHDWARE